jgi:pimeloyl-ACP methyl ester carboxylesterase
MFIANYAEAARQGVRGYAHELRILGRPWDFRLEEIAAPVHLWHGEQDANTPVGMALTMAARIPRCRTTFLPGEGHLFLFTRWEEILTALLT